MRWRNAAALSVLGGIVAAAVLSIPPHEGGAASPVATRLAAAIGWSGLVGEPRAQVATGQRVLVVLSAFSLADRVARAGGLASGEDERRWSAAALAAQQQFITNLGRAGVQIKPEFRFTKTLNGFSALLDPSAIALLERTPGVKGVYPVRIAFPATVSSRVLTRDALARGVLQQPGGQLSGFNGEGVTIALLDTGVDVHKAYLHGHVEDGFDIVGDGVDAGAKAKPTDPTALEQHGTEMAGVLVGAGGPGGLTGVAPGASVLPIRVAGWQSDVQGGYTVYSRTDQLLAGLERAVDPNGDGDAHDAARIALVPLVEPFAAFTDDPLARAATGALELDTLVVAAAGNDGPAGPAFGSVGGPAGAPSVLSVGAADARRATEQVRVVIRAGLDVELDREVPLSGAVAPARTLLLSPAALKAAPATGRDFFADGLSLVAGRAAVVPAGVDPEETARWAAEAGASAVLLHGRPVAPGSVGLDEETGVPVIEIPEATARLLAARPDAVIAIAAPRTTGARTGIAPFSSWGLAFDGGVKPELLAPGVGVVTSEPGIGTFGTVNGSSASAAIVAGAAALLAEARPDADAEMLRSLLIGGSRPLGRTPVTAQGTGVLDVGQAASGELVAEPPEIAFGRGTRDGYAGDRVLTLRNVSSRRLTVFVSTGQARKARVPLILSANRLEIEPGKSARLTVRTRPITIAQGDAASGALTVTPLSGGAIRIPWAVVLRQPRGLLGPISLSQRAFKPSETKPAVAVVRAGQVTRSQDGTAVVPVLRLDVELWTAKGKRLGLLARLRDLLPGRYAFGITGRGPAGSLLARGRYLLRVYAWPTGGGAPTLRSVAIAIR